MDPPEGAWVGAWLGALCVEEDGAVLTGSAPLNDVRRDGRVELVPAG